MKRHFLRRLWLTLLFAGTVGAIFWVGFGTLLWIFVIGDINPDSMPPLNEAQATFLVEHTRSHMLLVAVPPLLLTLLWGTTVAVLLARGRLTPDRAD